MQPSVRSLVAALVLCVSTGNCAAAAELPPVFSFSPQVTAAGQTITISASRFVPGTAAAIVSLMDEQGQRTFLGGALLSGSTSLNKTFALPQGLAPRRYLVHLLDSTGRIAINLTGALTITPVSNPWFRMNPSTQGRGLPVRITATGFPATSGGASVSLVAANGAVTVIGVTPLINGSFSRNFVLPESLPENTSFNVAVRDSSGRMAQNITGPLTIASGRAGTAVPVGYYPIGAAVDLQRNRVYVPNAGENTVSVIDGTTNGVIATVPVGELPCAIGANTVAGRIYVSNVNSRDVSVIDAATNSVIATIPVGDYPCAVATIPWSGRVYIGNYAANTVSVIDGTTNTVIQTIPVSSAPYGIGSNPATNRVYVCLGGDDAVAVIDGTSLAVVATIPVGKAPDAIGVNSLANRIYAANYFSDTVTVIDGATNQPAGTVPVGRQPSAIAVNQATGRVFVANYDSNTISVIDGFSNSVSSTLMSGRIPDGLATNPLTGRVYVVNSISNDVTVLEDLP